MSKEANDKTSKAANGKTDDTFVSDDKFSKVHDAVFRPDQFATLFCDAATSQVKVKDTLKQIIRELLESDTNARETLLGLIKQAMRDDWRTWWRSKGALLLLGLWSLLTIAFGAWISSYIANHGTQTQQVQQQNAASSQHSS